MRIHAAVQIALAILAFSVSDVLVAQEQPIARDEIYHQAVSQWIINGDGRAAADLLRKHIRKPRVLSAHLDRRENARLLNLLAWIEYDVGKGARFRLGDRLKTAEEHAADAVQETPIEVTYWRDLMRIAKERRGAESLRDAIGQQTLTIRLHRAEQAVMRALLEQESGSPTTAIDELKRFVESPANHYSCIAPLTLVELELSLDRVASANRHLQNMHRRCRNAVPDVRSRTAVALRLENRQETQSVLADWAAKEPYSWQRLRLRQNTGSPDDLVRAQDHRFELHVDLFRDPLRLDAWKRLWSLSITKKNADPEYLKVLERVRGRRADDSSPVLHIAATYPEMYEGKFESVRESLEGIVADEGYRGDVLATLVLTYAGLHTNADVANEYLTRLEVLNPMMASCLNDVMLRRCFVDQSQDCIPATAVCATPPDIVAKWMVHGYRFRGGAPDVGAELDYKLAYQGRQIRNDVNRLLAESENRTRAAIAGLADRQDSFERIVRGELTLLKEELGDERAARQALNDRLLGVEMRAQSLQRDLRSLEIRVPALESELSRLTMRVAYDEDMLKRLRTRFEDRLTAQDSTFQAALDNLALRFDELMMRAQSAKLAPAVRSELAKALAVLKNYKSAKARDVWEAVNTVLGRFLNFNFGVGEYVQVNILGTIDLMVDLLFGESWLPDLAPAPILAPPTR